MTTRSAVDKNIALVSGLSGKIQARPADTQANTNLSQPSEVKKTKEDSKGPLLVTANQQVDRSLFEPIEFNDTTDLNITDTAERTINKSVVDEIFPELEQISELFPEHSSSIINENDVILDSGSYPDTVEECIKIIDALRLQEKSLLSANTDNESFLYRLQADARGTKKLLEKEHTEREHWEGEYYRCFHEIQILQEEGGKNHRSIKELAELVQHLRETDVNTTSTETLVTIQRELTAIKLTLDTVETELLTEQNNHQDTRDTLLNSQNPLTAMNNNLTTALLNSVVVNTQLVMVQQELDCAVVGDISEMACSTNCRQTA